MWYYTGVVDETTIALCRIGGIGRRDGFKIHCPQGRPGSTPGSGTKPRRDFRFVGVFLLVFRRLCEEREATLASGAFGTALILAVETIATCLRRLRFGRAAKKKSGTARNSLLSLTRGCYFRKNRL